MLITTKELTFRNLAKAISAPVLIAVLLGACAEESAHAEPSTNQITESTGQPAEPPAQLETPSAPINPTNLVIWLAGGMTMPDSYQGRPFSIDALFDDPEVLDRIPVWADQICSGFDNTYEVISELDAFGVNESDAHKITRAALIATCPEHLSSWDGRADREFGGYGGTVMDNARRSIWNLTVSTMDLRKESLENECLELDAKATLFQCADLLVTLGNLANQRNS